MRRSGAFVHGLSSAQIRVHVQSLMEWSEHDFEQIPEVDRRAIDPPISVETATWSRAGQLDWWVKERQQWLGRVRVVDGKQRWIRSADLGPASG
jgi:hypothetical protein